ncbi:MAG: hypothetical protein AAGI08_16280, partial [Bacteroidota bacterium]
MKFDFVKLVRGLAVVFAVLGILLSIDVMLPGQETTWGIEDKRETRQTQRVPGRTMLELRGPAGIDSRS